MSTFERVRAFHARFLMPVKEEPEQPDLERLRLRIRLQIEETCELLAELLPSERGRRWVEGMRVELLEDFEIYVKDPAEVPLDLVAVARELADIDLITTGTAAELGIPHDLVVTEVDNANGRKLPGPYLGHAPGKAIKPPGWEPPDVAGVLAGSCRCRSYFARTGRHAEVCPLAVG